MASGPMESMLQEPWLRIRPATAPANLPTLSVVVATNGGSKSDLSLLDLVTSKASEKLLGRGVIACGQIGPRAFLLSNVQLRRWDCPKAPCTALASKAEGPLLIAERCPPTWAQSTICETWTEHAH
mmetsp:Transcript_34670/g.63252  ORF Transcript_34670/g.63252 Transcript_34670/m.63252 type:complete len:126 (+) Transcript_34670:381-758(+)